MMLLKDIINAGIGTVTGMYPSGEAREMVFSYLGEVLGIKRHTHIVEPEFCVAEEKTGGILRDFARMAEGEPLQYIIGKSWFYGRSFKVTPDVLIPRPETEILVENCLKSASLAGHTGGKILDLCTGSGCIAWTLALEMPGSEVVAVDISDAALHIASAQDFSEEMSNSGALFPTFIKADVLSDELPDMKYDMIVSNPPYVMDSEKVLMRPNVLDHEPHLALFVPDNDPLIFYRAVARHASRLLSEDGFGIVEINESLGEQTAEVFRSVGFSAMVLKDLSEKDRFVKFSF